MRTPWPLVLLAPLFVVTACGRQDAYQACSFQMSCASSAPLCLADTTATHRTVLFCSKRCATAMASAADCPNSGACVRLNGGDPVCMPHCNTTADCDFPGALCTVLPESMGVKVCAAQP